MPRLIAAVLALVTVAAAPPLHADGPASWPQHLGPSGDGSAGDADLPTTLGEDRHVKWKTAIPGRGWSSPVVHGEQVWMTTAMDEGRTRHAVCIDLNTSRLLHLIKLFDVPDPPFIHKLNSHASPTPAIEPGRVYVHFGTHGTAAIDTTTGKTLWQRTDLNLDHQVGAGSSPVLYRDKLIFHCDGIDAQYIVALDKRTGKTAWKTQRTADLASETENRRKAFSTPILIERHGKPLLVSVGANAVYGYNPDDGTELWRFGARGYSNVASPVVHNGLVIFSTAYDKSSLVAFKLPAPGKGPGKTGDITDTAAAWTFDRNVMYKPTPALVDGRLYMIADTGVLSCLDATTGDVVYRHRVGGNFSASPIVAGGLIYLFSEDGQATVFRPGATYEQVSAGAFDEGFMSTPAVVGDTMILRSKTHLYRIEK